MLKGSFTTAARQHRNIHFGNNFDPEFSFDGEDMQGPAVGCESGLENNFQKRLPVQIPTVHFDSIISCQSGRGVLYAKSLGAVHILRNTILGSPKTPPPYVIL